MKQVQGPWMEITPAGRRSSPTSAEARWHEFRTQLAQVAFMVRWNLFERSFGRALGRLWILLDPLMQAALYLFLLTYIFRLDGADVSYTFLTVSITFWRLHSNLVLGAPSIFIARASVLQQSSFPPRLIVFEFVLTELAFFGFNLLVAFAVITLYGVRPNMLWLLLPFVLLVQLAFSTALAMFVALLGTVLRDIGAFLVFIVSVWFYLSPVIYGVSRVPPALQPFMAFNPFATIMPAYHAIIFEGRAPSLLGLALVLAVSGALCWLGFRLLARAQHYFYRFL